MESSKMTVTIDRSSLDVERTILQLGHAHHGGFDGIADELLHLNRRHARALHRDDDLVIGQVGKRLKRQVQHDRNAADDKHQQERDNEPPVEEKEVDQFTPS